MRILIISPLIPYPLIDGGRKGIFYPMRFLSERGHRIHMACLSDVDDAPVSPKEVEKYCTLDVVNNSKKRTIAGLVKSLADPTPYLLSRFHNQKLLSRALAVVEQGVDVVLIDGLHCAYYGLAIMKRFTLPVVLRLHNVESMILDRFGEVQENLFVKTYVLFENRKLRTYEETYCPAFDRVMMISKADELDLQSRSSAARTVVVHAGVDTTYFSPEQGKEEQRSILWMAAFQWPPNLDSFWWFVREIVPVIVAKSPDVSIYIVGSHPPPEVVAFHHPNVRVVGFVEDVREYINKCAVAVVPLRVGGGIRLKLFELFAMKKAVVSTSVGCEGLNVDHNRHLMIADDIGRFAEYVVQLLSDPARRNRLGSEAASLVRSQHSWQETARQYEAVFESVLWERKALSAEKETSGA